MTKVHSVPTRQTRQRERASEMADQTVDRLTDNKLPPAEKASRKRKLVKVPDDLRPPTDKGGPSDE
jgi:hypothetical protein